MPKNEIASQAAQAGKIAMTERAAQAGKISMTEKAPHLDIDNLKWHYMAGDGDFRSKEVAELMRQADVVVTNPPFSLFREFLKWIVDGGKEFLIIGNMNAITYKEVFPLIRENKM